VVQKQIEHVLTITQIYHLEILEKDFLMPYLIEAVNLLPNITTLKIHSLSTDETFELIVNEIFISCSTKETSQILKFIWKKLII